MEGAGRTLLGGAPSVVRSFPQVSDVPLSSCYELSDHPCRCLMGLQTG